MRARIVFRGLSVFLGSLSRPRQYGHCPSRQITNASGDLREDLVRLAAMATAAQSAVAHHGKEGVIDPETLVVIENNAQEALGIVDRALQKVGKPCGASELGRGEFDSTEVAIPAKLMNWNEYLRAGYLRDMLEDTMCHLQVMPPERGLLEGAGKFFGKEEKLAALKKEFEEKHLQKKEPRLQGEVNVGEEELNRRREEMLREREMSNVLKGFQTALLDIGRTKKVTKGGTTLSMRAMVVIGNRKGVAGYGVGKSDTAHHAIARACRNAKRNMLALDRYSDRTIFHRVQGEYLKTKVSIWPKPDGTGITANNYYSAIFQLFGLKDIGAKMHGPRTMGNSVKALFNGLSRIRSAEQISRTRGLSVADVYGVRSARLSRQRQVQVP